MPHLKTILRVGVAILLASPSILAAPILNFVGGPVSATSGPRTYGWSFDVVEPQGIVVTHLSLFDYLNNGFQDAHEIGIWNADQELLAYAVIPAGTAAPLDETGRFRAIPIDAVALPPGERYVIGAFYPRPETVDFAVYQATGLHVDPMIQFVSGRVSFEPELSFPSVSTAGLVPRLDPAFFGPSFHAVAVPEPGSLALLGLGSLAGLVVLVRRTRGRRSPSIHADGRLPAASWRSPGDERR